MHGRGVYIWEDGRRYEGEYQHDKKHGFGVYSWTDGSRYEGQWVNGKQHGHGKYKLPNGQVRTGIWENGERAQWTDEQQDLYRGYQSRGPTQTQTTSNYGVPNATRTRYY